MLANYKLRKNKPLIQQGVEYLEQILWQELGSKEQYEKDYGDTPVSKFVRKTVGLDRQAFQQDMFSSVSGIKVVFKDQLPKARGFLDIIDRINRNVEDIS